MQVCYRFDMVPDLTLYLHQKGMVRYIEGYVQKVNPQKTPKASGVGRMLRGLRVGAAWGAGRGMG